MPSLTALRDTAVAALREVLTDVSRVEAFAGEVTLDAIAGKGLQAGVSVFVALVSVDNGSDAPLDLDVTATFGALVVSSNPVSAEDREAEALRVAEKVVLTLHGATFSLPDVSPVALHSLEPVLDEALSDNGLAVWSALWTQALTLPPVDTPVTLPVFPHEEEDHGLV